MRHRVSRERVLGIKLQRSPNRHQSGTVAADVGVVEAANGMLEDAQAFQHARRVYQVNPQGEQHAQRLRDGRIAGQHPGADSNGSADSRDLDLRFLGGAGECQQIKERDAEQQSRAKAVCNSGL